MSASAIPGTAAALAVRDLAFRYPGGAADAVALTRISFSITRWRTYAAE